MLLTTPEDGAFQKKSQYFPKNRAVFGEPDNAPAPSSGGVIGQFFFVVGETLFLKCVSKTLEKLALFLNY